jgi:hypothetical protein
LGVLVFIAAWMAASSFAQAPRAAGDVARKLDLIESGRAKPGAAIVFTSAELNAWVRAKASAVVPEGFREPHLQLGDGTATGSALVDFLKLRSAAGAETSWFVARLIEGEKPVKAVAEIRSANGKATVHLRSVEIGGLAVSGTALDFLIQNFFLPLYPNAKIDEPFELADGIDHIQIVPGAARVYIKKK